MADNARYGIAESATTNGFVVCDNCKETVPCFSQVGLPEHGLTFSLSRLDYYGGFTNKVVDGDKDLLLCHDCSLILVKALPAIANLCKGSHPCDLDKPCCDFAWRATDKFGKYEVNKSGEYVPVKGVHIQIAENGQWVDTDV